MGNDLLQLELDCAPVDFCLRMAFRCCIIYLLEAKIFCFWTFGNFGPLCAVSRPPPLHASFDDPTTERGFSVEAVACAYLAVLIEACSLYLTRDGIAISKYYVYVHARPVQ